MNASNSDKNSGVEVPSDHLLTAQKELSVEERILLAGKEGRAAGQGATDEQGAPIRQHILRILALDAEVRVRIALADTLAENALAPHDVVMQLARDVDLVSSPLLRLSEVLTDKDLLEIVSAQSSSAKMAAIAQRKHVAPPVCMALIERGPVDVAELLLHNKGADIPEPGYMGIVEKHGQKHSIQAGLVDRSALPPTVIERIVAMVSSDLLTRLVDRHDLPVAVAAKLALSVRDRATLGLASGLSADAMDKLVDQLSSERRLTQSLLLRSLCLGNFELVIHAIANRANLGVGYVRERLFGGMSDKIDELWSRGSLPTALLPIAKAALQIMRETEVEGPKWDASYYRGRITERLLSQFADFPHFTDEDLAFIVAASGTNPAGPDDFTSSGKTLH